MNIPGLRGLSPGSILKETVREFFEDDMTTYASALAYQVLFSLFPFLIFLIALLGFIERTEFFDWVRQQMQYLLPDPAMKVVDQVIAQLRQPQHTLLSVGVIVALWSASAAVRATMNALNVAYDVPEGRPAWKLYPLSIIYTIGVAAMLIAAALLMSVGPEAIEWITRMVGMDRLFAALWTWLRWPVAVFLLCLALAVVYYVAPDVEQEFRFITPGATLAVIVWIAASLAFKYYVANFADYNATYGSVGTIVVLLLYFFISAAVMLFGAELNAVIEHRVPSGKNRGEKKMPDEGEAAARSRPQ
ncbi:MAG TPA: YihY/virulence factor BrkB family protein [Paucimonas sp.]|nr:YihY/virulence factor BrkB family protein [Paucimonas sp.]